MIATIAALQAATQSAAIAQQYPTRPIRIISPFAPGGGTDFVARLISPKLTAQLGQQIIVDNRPGAGGSLGVEIGVRTPPDGYTFIIVSSGYTVNPSFYKLKFDPVEDISPVIQIAQGPLLITAHPSMPAKNARELIALAKSKPGDLTFSTSGQGSIGHMVGELFSYMAHVKMTHVPYKGTGPALIDTIAGQTVLNIGGITGSLPYVKSRQLRAIAVTTVQRVPQAPDVATVAESGLPGYEVSQWQGLIAPKGLPPAIAERINNEIAAIIKEKEMANRFELAGIVPAGGSPEQFLAEIRKEIGLWQKVVIAAGIKPE